MTGQRKRHKQVEVATIKAPPLRASRAKAKPSAAADAGALALPESGQGHHQVGEGAQLVLSAEAQAGAQEGSTKSKRVDETDFSTASPEPVRRRRKSSPLAYAAPPLTPVDDSEPSKPKRGRREQKRAIETKQAILGAALQEFARKGFDAASIRDIADRLGIQHPLITYHYKTKEVLWQAVAEQIVSEVKEDMDAQTRNLENVKPLDRVRAEFRALLHIQHKYPFFHHFMLNESREKGPRLQWLAQNVLAPMVNQNLPEIRRAQAAGDLPAGEPVLLHYMLIGMTSALISLGAEIDAVTGYSVDSPGIEDIYFDLIDQIMFKRRFSRDASDTRSGTEESLETIVGDRSEH